MVEFVDPNWELVARAVLAQPRNARAILERFEISRERLLPLCRPPEEGDPYGRKVLFRSEDLEVMLATWTSGAECLPHDHGFSSGTVWLAAGRFTERRFMLGDDLDEVGTMIIRQSGAFVHVTDDDIHSMRSLDAGISLHVYSPPVHAMKVYDKGSRSTLTVSDDCGAWVPRDEAQIRKRAGWAHKPSIDEERSNAR